MLTTTTAYNTAISASVRKIKAKAEFYQGSALVDTYTDEDRIISFDIQRIGDDGKFFGFGVCQRLNIHLIDKDRELAYSTANSIKIGISPRLVSDEVETEYITYPTFYVSEIHRDEKTNELSITAYDAIYPAAAHTVSELVVEKPYTTAQFAAACATLLGVGITGTDSFTVSYENGANFDGTETIREALDYLAEATQTIYFINSAGTLCFKQLSKEGNAVLAISKDTYFEFSSGSGKRLQTICSATELGDNVSESTTQIGSTQYVRDNPFWELRDDIATLIHNGIEAIGNITIDVFSCSWRGNPILEVGDKITLQTRDNQTITSYVLNDKIEYNGALKETTQWKYNETSAETESNPTSIGDAIKQTYARVDKQNKQIDLVASKTDELESKNSALQIATDKISMEVKESKQTTKESLDALNSSIQEVQNSVKTSISAQDVQIQIENSIKNINSVSTTTGFKFDENGLQISKSDSNISTIVNEDGMKIESGSTVLLDVNNTGVDAINLFASQYLRIGNTRFEDYSNNTRTGAFWVGGNN